MSIDWNRDIWVRSTPPRPIAARFGSRFIQRCSNAKARAEDFGAGAIRQAAADSATGTRIR